MDSSTNIPVVVPCEKATITAGIHPIYGPAYGITFVIPQNKPNNKGALSPHNRKAKDETTNIIDDNYLKDVVTDLQESLDMAKAAGMDMEQVCIDPGIGFAKNLEQNLILMNHLEDLQSLKYPVLLGTSRKSMIGLTLDLPVDQRVEGTLATTVIGMLRGCSFVRVHDIKENHRIIQMTKAILSC